MFTNKDEFMLWLYNSFYRDMLSAGERFVHVSYPNREDIIHGAIVSTFQAANENYEKDKLGHHPNIKGWIYRTLYNRLHDEIKKSVRYYSRSNLRPNEELSRMAQIDVFDQWIANEEYRELLDQIKQIRKTPMDHVIYQEYFVEKMSAKEIAKKNVITEGKVKGIIYRMRKRAKKLSQSPSV